MVIRLYLAAGLGIALIGLGIQPSLGQAPEATVPESKLNRDSSLLSVPTQASDVEIKLDQPLTLQQAYELALRNNLTLQVTELQLQQNQSFLSQAKAANWPTLSVQSALTRTDSANFLLNQTPIQVDAAAQLQAQQRTLLSLQTQQFQSQQELSIDIQQLQLRLQQDQNQSQQQIFDQQIQQLQLRANTSATPFAITNVTPLQPIAAVPISQGNTGGISNRIQGTVSATYNIYTSGFRSGQIEAAKAQVKISELELKRQLEQLRLDVANDYYNLQQSSALITVSKDAVRNAEASLEVARVREQAGIGTKFDVLQAEVQLADTIQNATQADNLQKIAQRQLAQRLNVKETVNLSAADQVNIAGGWLLNLEDSIVLALQNRVELAQLLSQRRLAQQQRRVALAANKPQLQAFASAEVVDELDDNVSGAFGYAVGLQVSINFFDGGAAKSRAAQQEENIAIAETQFADTKNDLRFEVEQAYADLQSNLRNINTAQSSVQLAEESLALARLRSSAGIGTQLDVTSAENSLTQAKGNLVSAILNYNRALIALQRATSFAQPVSGVTPLGG
ncbi:TolC family protein [Acaryochloris marina]|uniref:Outer membrane efflux protein n=1 Tax=Acaryochloris marina (strain MBIC 11017) TaxID=329726 RepID=B0C446_ACAM1|nr:TolC family protein [Acaryochloris marina]ABW27437.1 outer membrane efflux protein [Acaryochloris marina MBIC11017]BDM82175.1 transporter [Acaryochloris marina MBIC10699]